MELWSNEGSDGAACAGEIFDNLNLWRVTGMRDTGREAPSAQHPNPQGSTKCQAPFGVPPPCTAFLKGREEREGARKAKLCAPKCG
jgi:hypothetical protein